MSSKKSAAIGFIFITMLIDIIGIGIIIPVIPKLLQELNHSDISEAAQLGGWLAFAYAFTQFLCAPLMGSLSDKYGRRPVLLISLMAFAIDYLVLAMAPNVPWLFAGRIIAGITGASISTAMAYISDVSTPQNKAKNFGLVGAAFGIGFIIGPVIGGLLGQYGSRVPFYAAAVLCFVNFIYGYFVLPESLKPEKRRIFEWKAANPIGALSRLKKFPNIIGLVTAMFFMYFASHAVNGNWSFYTMYRYHWDERMVGISLGVVGLLVAIVQGGLVRYINPKIGNGKSILTGFFLNAIGQFLIAVATQEWMIFVFLIPYCMGGLAGPAIQSEITNHVPSNEQGQIQGTLASLNSATATFGPLVMTSIFYYFTHDDAPFKFPGAPFILAAFLMFAALIFAYNSLKKTQSI
ncbi:MFS transporter, DHA1 family, tetracycline resistance protein [Paenimyroides aquimaris]|uniref:MFS transporter, DHA1 family, tetracycline resistance protein n=1 Tax=Paenimyroides marinum TaxID=1159016 RepID=A0A1H6L5K5_9FLAO|nr:TCR/Tet family MFS transporter [Paenimyroides aquimaris]SEH79656.1 MFS transporter, DHA1 family, tetracycline resistance protein [Paenimyroides aquimaris]